MFSETYISLLIKEIPKSKSLDLAILLYRRKGSVYTLNIGFALSAIINYLNEEEIEQFTQIISDELKEITLECDFRIFLKKFPCLLWPKIQEIPKIRVENKILNLIKKARIYKLSIRLNGRDDFEENFNSEALSLSWGINLTTYFSNRNLVFWALIEKSKSHRSKMNFVSQYFLPIFPSLIESLDTEYYVDLTIDLIAKAWLTPQDIADNEPYEEASYSCSSFKNDLL